MLYGYIILDIKCLRKEKCMTDILDRETMTALDEIQMTLTVDSVEYKVSTMPSACMTCYGGCEGDCEGECKDSSRGH